MANKMLIIEDSKHMLQVMEGFFKKEGYEVIDAETGRKGMEMVLSQKPDIVLIDTVLPDVGGFEVYRKIKESEENKTRYYYDR